MLIVVDGTDGVFSVLSSTGMSPGEDSPDDRGGGAGPLYQIQGDLPQPAHPAGAGGSLEDLWSVFYISALVLGHFLMTSCSICFASLSFTPSVLHNILYCDISIEACLN